MKELLILAAIAISSVLSAQQCCPNTELIRSGGYCNGSIERISIDCPFGHMLLTNMYLDGNKLHAMDSPNYVFAEDPNDYCIGKMYRNETDLVHTSVSTGDVPVAVVCFQSKMDKTVDIETTGYLTLTSVVFLVMTVAVYAYIGKLRDLQGLCYMCMCISMALGFLSLGLLQLSPGFQGDICTAAGFLIYFWLTATFFWMNVICINVYRSVVDASYLKKTERRQYGFYSIYAWGCSSALLIFALVTNFTEGDHMKPDIGPQSCWFTGRSETWLFFYGPIAILIGSNVIIFILSSFNLWRQTRKYEVSKLNILKYKFLLSLKLFLVMGISWVFEIASFAHGESHIVWTIMDTFNCLQGLVIFILLVVLRKRAIQGLAEQGFCLPVTGWLANKLSPHDDEDDQAMLAEDQTEVRLN